MAAPRTTPPPEGRGVGWAPPGQPTCGLTLTQGAPGAPDLPVESQPGRHRSGRPVGQLTTRPPSGRRSCGSTPNQGAIRATELRVDSHPGRPLGGGAAGQLPAGPPLGRRSCGSTPSRPAPGAAELRVNSQQARPQGGGAASQLPAGPPPGRRSCGSTPHRGAPATAARAAGRAGRRAHQQPVVPRPATRGQRAARCSGRCCNGVKSAPAGRGAGSRRARVRSAPGRAEGPVGGRRRRTRCGRGAQARPAGVFTARMCPHDRRFFVARARAACHGRGVAGGLAPTAGLWVLSFLL
jgi:hypothetical protein